MAYSTPYSLRKRSVGDLKQDKAPLTAILPQAEARGLPLHHGQGLEFTPRIKSRPWKHILSSQGLGGYTRRVRSCAPPREEQRQKPAESPATTWLKTQHRPNSTYNQCIASEGVYLLLHRLKGYTRWVRSHASPRKKQPKNKPRPQQ
jgi:hypothetical protein